MYSLPAALRGRCAFLLVFSVRSKDRGAVGVYVFFIRWYKPAQVVQVIDHIFLRSGTASTGHVYFHLIRGLSLKCMTHTCLTRTLEMTGETRRDRNSLVHYLGSPPCFPSRSFSCLLSAVWVSSYIMLAGLDRKALDCESFRKINSEPGS